MKRILKRTAMLFSALLIGVLSFFESLAFSSVSAETSDIQAAFENINVLDDLRSDESFSLYKYPYYDSANPEMYLINVVEFCYSYKESMQDDYGLYLYVYNPNGQKIVTDSALNKVSIAVDHEYDETEKVLKPTNYEKFRLQCCSVSETSGYERLFYKFKVIDPEKKILKNLNSSGRRYDLAEFELLTSGKNTATAYPVTGTFALGVDRKDSYGTLIFTGYAKGYGPNEDAESSLKVSYSKLETISLDLRHTFWRSETSSLGKHHQNQVDTVYFSVPNEYFEKYGTLQRIKAEWYEYKTKDIIVTSNNDFYDTSKQYIGQTCTGQEEEWGYGLVDDPQWGRMVLFDPECADPELYGYGSSWGWNPPSEFSKKWTYCTSTAPSLYYLFLCDDISSYDPSKPLESMGGIKGTDLYKRMLEVSQQLGGEKIEAKDGRLISAIFEDDIDESRKIDNERGKIQKGYSYYDFDASLDITSWTSWADTNPSFWVKWRDYGFFNALFDDVPSESGKVVAPIVDLKDSDFSGTATEISRNLMVNQSDVSALQSFYNSEKEDNHVIAFRFAVSDYYSSPCSIVDFDGIDSFIDDEAYRSKESVFFDFDVIQLTFSDDGELTVIPVVASPIDIVNDITPPPDVEDKNWLKIFFALLALIVLLVIFMPILPTLVSGIVQVLCLPFKLLSALFKGISKAFHKRE